MSTEENDLTVLPIEVSASITAKAVGGNKRRPRLGGRQITLTGALFCLLFLPILPVFAPSSSLASAEVDLGLTVNQVPILPQAPLIQNNSFLAEAHYLSEPEPIVMEVISVMATAYSSSVWETDDTPFITASGTQTREGVVASNLLPFGTKIRLPEIFGKKTFVVEDRLNERMGDFQIDVWMPSAWEARQFGVKYTYIETIK
jgi:3D (Asp-Asp-Asp) domain-containing protein